MADVKIADLLSATTVNNNDLFVVEDNADTKKITWANLKAALDASLEAHKAESVSQAIEITRDISLTGDIIISTSRRAKAIQCIAVMLDGTQPRSTSTGFWSENGGSKSVASLFSGSTLENEANSTNIIQMGQSSVNRNLGAIAIVTDNSFTIQWTKQGTPTGNAMFYFLVSYH